MLKKSNFISITALTVCLQLYSNAATAKYNIGLDIGNAQSISDGMTFINSKSIETMLNKNNYGKTLSWGVGVGLDSGHYAGLNRFMLWMHTRAHYSIDKYAVQNNSNQPSEKLHLHGKIKNRTFMLYGRYGLFNVLHTTFNLKGGGGISYNEAYDLNEILDETQTKTLIENNKKATPAYSIGASLSVVYDSINIELGYRYINLGKFASGVIRKDINGADLAASFERIPGNLSTKEAFLEISYAL